MLGMLFDAFLFISTHITLVWFSPGSAETDTGWGKILNGHLMASRARNNRTKNYQNWISLLEVTIDNVQNVFFRIRCIAETKMNTGNCNMFNQFFLIFHINHKQLSHQCPCVFLSRYMWQCQWKDEQNHQLMFQTCANSTQHKATVTWKRKISVHH